MFVNIDDIIIFCNKMKKMNVNKKDIVSYWDCVIIFVVKKLEFRVSFVVIHFFYDVTCVLVIGINQSESSKVHIVIFVVIQINPFDVLNKKYKIFLYDSNPHGKKFGRKIINTKWHISAGIFLLMITRSTTVSYQSCQNIVVVWIDHALLESLYTKEDE